MHTGDAADSSQLRLLGWYRRIMRFLAGTSMMTIVVIMIVQVFARYVLNASLIWAEEICRYILIWQTFLFIGMAYERGELVAVEFFTELLSPLRRFILKLAMAIPILIFLWLMVTNGYTYASRFTGQTLPAIDFLWSSLTGHTVGLSVRWVYISVAVGSALLALHLIVDLVADARKLTARPRDVSSHRSSA